MKNNLMRSDWLIYSYFDYPDPRLFGLFRLVPTSPDNRGSTVHQISTPAHHQVWVSVSKNSLVVLDFSLHLWIALLSLIVILTSRMASLVHAISFMNEPMGMQAESDKQFWNKSENIKMAYISPVAQKKKFSAWNSNYISPSLKLMFSFA